MSSNLGEHTALDGFEEGSEPGPSKKRPRYSRVRNACARCKARKQKCDLRLPRCTNCEKAGQDCTASSLPGPDAADLPRDYVFHLENKVKQLEASLKEASPLTAELNVGNGGTEANAHALGRPSTGLEFATLMHASLHFASQHTVDTAGINNHRRHSKRGNAHFPRLPRRQPLPTQEQAEALISSFFANRWPNYPIFSESRFRSDILRDVERNGLSAEEPSLFLFFMVSAVATLDQGRGHEGIDSSFAYYETATAYYLESLLAADNLVTLQGLLLLTIYSLSDPRSVSLWHIIGIMMRMCLDRNLHRLPQLPSDHIHYGDVEMHSRVFWCCFALDRTITVALGRPVAVADGEITTPLPAEVDDPYLTRFASADSVLRISAFIHVIRLRRYNGLIQSTLMQPRAGTFNDDLSIQQLNLAQRVEMKETLRRKLDEWLLTAPVYEEISSTYHSREWFSIAHAHSILILGRSSMAASSTAPSEVDLENCAEASTTLIRSYLRLYAHQKVTYTWLALHSLFLAAVMFLFALQQVPRLRHSTSYEVVESTIQGTNSLFAAMSLQWPFARRCQKLIEELGSQTLQLFPQPDTSSQLPQNLQESNGQDIHVPVDASGLEAGPSSFQNDFDLRNDLEAWLKTLDTPLPEDSTWPTEPLQQLGSTRTDGLTSITEWDDSWLFGPHFAEGQPLADASFDPFLSFFPLLNT
ncbi:hypothetical protein T439DRAFT_322893 [Meredithblackwellia eburnea MCA 4105]